MYLCVWVGAGACIPVFFPPFCELLLQQGSIRPPRSKLTLHFGLFSHYLYGSGKKKAGLLCFYGLIASGSFVYTSQYYLCSHFSPYLLLSFPSFACLSFSTSFLSVFFQPYSHYLGLIGENFIIVRQRFFIVSFSLLVSRSLQVLILRMYLLHIQILSCLSYFFSLSRCIFRPFNIRISFLSQSSLHHYSRIKKANVVRLNPLFLYPFHSYNRIITSNNSAIS